MGLQDQRKSEGKAFCLSQLLVANLCQPVTSTTIIVLSLRSINFLRVAYLWALLYLGAKTLRSRLIHQRGDHLVYPLRRLVTPSIIKTKKTQPLNTAIDFIKRHENSQ